MCKKELYDATLKILIFGDRGSGSRTLVQRFLTNLFVTDLPEFDMSFELKSLYVDSKKVLLNIWNFLEQERKKFLLPTFMRGSQGGLFLYDITNYTSLAHIDDWLSIIRKEIRAENSFPIIVVGCKTDLVEDREVSTADGIKIAQSRNANGFVETSSKTGENIEKAFEVLARLLL